MTAIISVSNGQSDGKQSGNGQQSQFLLTFNQQDFAGRFSVLYTSDDNYDYYVIDLTKLNDRFERVYFMNLAYNDARIVNLDGDLDKDQTWFKAYYKYNNDEITCLFNDLKEKTEETRLGMTAEEKTAWMTKNDKFTKIDKK